MDLVSPTHVYVLVNLRQDTAGHEFFVVPSQVVAENTKVEVHRRSTWYSLYRRDIEEHRDAWHNFRSSGGAT